MYYNREPLKLIPSVVRCERVRVHAQREIVWCRCTKTMAALILRQNCHAESREYTLLYIIHLL